jgi:hypothetical protein
MARHEEDQGTHQHDVPCDVAVWKNALASQKEAKEEPAPKAGDA